MKVELTRQAQKDLKKLPQYIVDKFYKWVLIVEETGIQRIKEIPGWRDEPLIGKRKGQRSIRLSKAYRAIYREEKGKIEFVEVLEINKHKY